MQFDSSIPIYRQIKDVIKKRIVSGELTSGSKIAPVRDLALEMSVNPNTMQKALAELESEGYLRSERTSGRYVTENTNLLEEMKNEMLQDEIKKFLDALGRIGLSEDEILQILGDYIKKGKLEAGK